MVVGANLHARHSGQLATGVVRSETHLDRPIPVVSDVHSDALAAFIQRYSFPLRDDSTGNILLGV